MEKTENTRIEIDPEEIERASARTTLELRFGKDNVFDTAEMQEHFTVQAFMAPFVAVTRSTDGCKGSLQFTHRPRFYFDFQPI